MTEIDVEAINRGRKDVSLFWLQYLSSFSSIMLS